MTDAANPHRRPAADTNGKPPATPSIGRSLLPTAGLFPTGEYWSWSLPLLPAVVGTVLPFWLRPPGFSLRWFAAIEFLCATVLFHAGFSYLLQWFDSVNAAPGSRFRVLGTAGGCVAAACLLGLHLNDTLVLHSGVSGGIFIVYGLCAIFTAILYVAPPFRFSRRVGGEIVLSAGLGLLPLLGAYLVQVGDITRKVYLVAVPLVLATGLWIWIRELMHRSADERTGRGTMVILFGPRFSGRTAVLLFTMLIYATISAAVLSGALSPVAFFSLLSSGLALNIVTIAWNHSANEEQMRRAETIAARLHFVIGTIIIASSLAGLLR